jgi:hypothetical protein
LTLPAGRQVADQHHLFGITPDTNSFSAKLVFRDDTEGARVAIVLNDYLYDLNGVLVGRLKGRHVIDANTRSMPIGFRKLLEGKS